MSYSVKLYHADSRKYEPLAEIMAESRAEAIKKFKGESGWVEKEGQLLVALPPLCR
tara:strand:- start:4280 stop:4447 length:168 start_codon:yes stop_codon:yes gene_type:complete